MPARILATAAIAASLFLPSAAAIARDEPLWELGAGVAGVGLPDYRGSSRSQAYALPMPYFIYRGDFFKADRDGVRGVLFDSERVDFSVSFGAALPVDSSHTPLREGMPDLNPLVEVGPSVQVHLVREPGLNVDFRSPLRAAITVESSPRYVGLQLFPHLNVDLYDLAGHRGLNLGVLVGPVLTDRRYNEYFYSVPAEFAAPGRPAYEAKGGYGGVQFIAALSRRFPRFWAGAFVRYDSLAGATFADSPLVDSKRYVAGGLGISWIFAESDRRVATPRR